MGASKLYKIATELEKSDFVPQAQEVYKEVILKFPRSDEAELAKTRIDFIKRREESNCDDIYGVCRF